MSTQFNDEIEMVGQLKQSEAYLDIDLQKSARLNFIKKVYSILTMQLAVTVGFCILAYNIESFLQFQINNPALLWVSFGLLLIIQILIICTSLGKTHPINLLLLLGFTLCESYSVSFICSTVAREEGGEIVVTAAGMTLGIFAALTVYACTTKRDFTVSQGIMLTILTSLMMLGFVCMFSRSPFMNNLLCTLGVIIFGIYIIIDTQMIMGSHKYGITMDDYILGALILYIDIIQLFLYILRLLSERR